MRQWEADHQWAQQFVPHISAILAQVFVKEAPVTMDMRENTDLVLVMEGNRIAVRVRQIKEYSLYNRRNEWTIRTSRPSGNQTELSKILYGWGDYYFYSWGDPQDQQIKAYAIIDLKPVRPWLFDHTHRLMQQHGQSQRNKDGSSAFVAVCLDELPAGCIVSRHTVATLEQQQYLDERLTLAERQVHRAHRQTAEQQGFDFEDWRL